MVAGDMTCHHTSDPVVEDHDGERMRPTRAAHPMSLDGERHSKAPLKALFDDRVFSGTMGRQSIDNPTEETWNDHQVR